GPPPPPTSAMSNRLALQQQQQQNRWRQQSGTFEGDSRSSTTSSSDFIAAAGLPRQSPAPSLLGDRRQQQQQQVESNVKINGLQMRLLAEESARKWQRIEADQQIHRLRDENIRLQSREGSTEERSRLATVTAELQTVRDEYQDYRSKTQRTLDDCQRNVTRLNREKLELEERATADKERLALELKEARNRVFELTSRELRMTEEARMQAEIRSKELSEWKAHLAEREAQLEESSKLQARVNELELQAKLHESERARLKSANEAIDRYEQVRQQNARLKEQLAAAKQIRDDRLVLEEENRSLRGRLESAESRAATLAADLAAAQTAEAKQSDRSANQSLTADHWSSESARLASAQRELALATAGRAELQIAVSAAERSLSESAAAQSEAEAKIQRLETELGELKRRLRLLSRERDMLKEFVASYLLDCTLGGSGSEQAYLQRISNMESLLDDYKRQLDEALAEKSSTASAAPSRLSLPVESQQQQQQASSRLSLGELASKQEASLVIELRQQITELHKRLAAAEEDKEMLAAREARLSDLGDADPRFTRVLHLVQNPAQEAEEARENELAELRKKLEKALTRCEKLEEKLKNRAAAGPADGEAAAATAGSSAAATSVIGDMTRDVSMIIERLKTELDRKDLQKQRQREAFRTNTEKMREAVHRLLGYRVQLESDNPSERLFRISSTYVDFDEQDSDKTSFLFRLNDDNVDLLTTDYVSEWQSDVRHYVQERNSVPAFLATVTLNYFGSSTTLVSSSVMGATTIS
uniref:TPR_MLP1_2 domain-containing protein n=1 Tax=Macrostomum lignano TaxID=282301 RepID=A0A1I8I0V7_9PLAT